MTWTVNLQTRTGGALITNAPLEAFRAVWSIDGPGSFEAEIGEDDAANWLAGQRRIQVLLNGTAKWTGWLTALTEQTKDYTDLSKPRGATLVASGLGLASVLERRIVHGDFNKFLTVATTIAWNLIQEAQSQSNGDYGFTLGTVTGTAPARTRHFCDGDIIADAINELAAKDPGGFDWEISETGQYNAWVGGRGTASGETLQRSEAMTWDVSNETTELATVATVLGSTEENCGAPLVIRSSTLASTYGRLEVVAELDSNDSGEMNEAGDEELRSRIASRVRLKATWPENKAPWAWGAVWLGDTLTVTLPAHFGGAQTMRVIEIAVSVEPPSFAYIEYEFEVVAAVTQADLDIDNASHSHTASNVTLDASGALGVAAASHTHVASNVVLTQVHSLTIQAATHAHTPENVVIDPSGATIANASHALTSTVVALTQVHTLVIQSASHTHTAENLVLTVSPTGPGDYLDTYSDTY